MSNTEPLSKMPVNTLDCRFCEKRLKSGTGRAAHERHCPKNPDYVPSKKEVLEQQRLADQQANPNHQCPECKAEGTERGFANAGSLGAHRRSVHGIVGKVTLESNVLCTYVDPDGVPCTFRGKTQAGMLTHYARKHVGQGGTSQALVTTTNGNGNGHTPAELRRVVRNQLQNRADLVAVVRVVYPHGIPTDDERLLDDDLGFIALTAQKLESR